MSFLLGFNFQGAERGVTPKLFCQAQPSPNPSWAEVALVSIDPATRHPPIHPGTQVKLCQDSVWAVSGQYQDSARTV